MRKLKNFFHLLEAFLANVWYRFPARKIKVIGVTGTDGKTTTVNLIAHILKNAGKKVSFISTVYAEVAGKIYDTGLHVTTPSSFVIQKFLRQAVNNGDDYFVLETTSHALDQNRVWGINFEIGIITNITHEHLDYHKTYENYVKTKEKLITVSKIGIINKKDKFYELLSQNSKLLPDGRYGKCQNYNLKLKTIKKYFPDLPEFNLYNYSASFLTCEILGLNEEKIIKAMKSFNLPKGRWELVYDKEFKVIIDFAHTPNAFKQLLPEIRKLYLKKGGRLIHIFGSAGLRDYLKRPLMGEISSQFSDYIILTEEDYRTEDLENICNQIAKGIKKTPFEIIKNREEAIIKGILIARKGDVVLITGKAHEKSLCRGKTEYPWNEFEIVEKAILIKNKQINQ